MWQRTKRKRPPDALHTSGAMRNAGCALLHFPAGGAPLETRYLDELNKKVSELIAASPAKDVEKNLRALLSNAFSRLDLVTREEFDVQQEVLARTRDKLQQMEAKVATLEASLTKGETPRL